MKLNKIRNFLCTIGGSMKYLDAVEEKGETCGYPLSVYSHKYDVRLKAVADLLTYLLRKYDLEIIHKNHFFGYCYYVNANYNLRFLLKYKFPSDCYPILCFLKKIQMNCEVAFDLGANKGLVSCFLSQRSKTVHSFEPGRDTSIAAKRNLMLNKIDNVTWNEMAVGSKNEKMKFYDYGMENSGHNSLLQVHEEAQNVYEVEVVRIEDYCKEKNITYIDFMKLDVEGFEKAALDGCGEMLSGKKIGMIVFEVSPEIIQDWEEQHAMLQRLIAVDYQIFNLYLEELTVEEIEKSLKHQDVVAIQKDCVEKYRRYF